MDGLSPLPDGFTRIQQAINRGNGFVNVIGVVADFLPPIQTRGSDMSLTFNIIDLSVHEPRGLRIRVFKSTEAELPSIGNVGDVVILRKLNMQNKNYGLVGLFNFSTEAAVFPHNRMLMPKDKVRLVNQQIQMSYMPEYFTPTIEEQLHVIDLHAHVPLPNSNTTASTPLPRPSSNYDTPKRQLPSENPSPQMPPKSASSKSSVSRFRPSNKFKLIKDLSLDCYADLVVEIRKSYYNSDFDGSIQSLDLSVTDYTEHHSLYNHERPDDEAMSDHNDQTEAMLKFVERSYQSKMKIPPGKYTLPIKLFPPHASAARRNFQEGDVCFLKNIRTKVDYNNNLEARLSADQKFPDQVNIRKIDHSDQLVQDLLNRKSDYEKRLNIPKPVNKTNKQNRQERKARKRQAAEERRALERREAELATTAAARKAFFNPHIVAAHQQKNISSLTEIIDNPHRINNVDNEMGTLPFVNANYRAVVRVVDFWPPNLADFAKSTSDYQYKPRHDSVGGSESGGEDECMEVEPSYHTESLSQHEKAKWEWAFVLLVEDASNFDPRAIEAANKDGDASRRLRIRVSDEAGQYLLKMDAADLDQDSQTLAKLREKLFILWGDLEEHKVNDPNATGSQLNPSSQPFECCIHEYGVPDEQTPNGWSREWALFGTTVKQ